MSEQPRLEEVIDNLLGLVECLEDEEAIVHVGCDPVSILTDAVNDLETIRNHRGIRR